MTPKGAKSRFVVGRGVSALCLGLALALAPPMQGAAQSSGEVRAALVFLESYTDTSETRALMRGAVQELLQVTVARRPGLEHGQIMALSALYDEAMRKALLGAQRAEARALARRFTQEEIAALSAFAATEEGRAALEETGIPGQDFDAALRREIDRAQGAALDRFGNLFD
ncbi:MAG: hypothetical protein JJU40_07420 [Rhodobacteraceae bacterium]|nr:hypothetical protein [Paracoccaceae bacterium]